MVQPTKNTKTTSSTKVTVTILPYFNLVLKGFFLNHRLLNLCSRSRISNNLLPCRLKLLDFSKELLFLRQRDALVLNAVLQAVDLFPPTKLECQMDSKAFIRAKEMKNSELYEAWN